MDRISTYSVGGAWRGKCVVCRSVGGYCYLSRRDEVVGVQIVGSRGRLRMITMPGLWGR